jgi:hypothetical protein
MQQVLVQIQLAGDIDDTPIPIDHQVRSLNPVLRRKRTPTTRHQNILPGDHRPAISDVHYFWGTSDQATTPPNERRRQANDEKEGESASGAHAY